MHRLECNMNQREDQDNAHLDAKEKATAGAVITYPFLEGGERERELPLSDDAVEETDWEREPLPEDDPEYEEERDADPDGEVLFAARGAAGFAIAASALRKGNWLPWGRL